MNLKKIDKELKEIFFDNFIDIVKDQFSFLEKDIKDVTDSDCRSMAFFTIGYFNLMEDKQNER